MQFHRRLESWSDAVLERGRILGCVDTTLPAELQRSLVAAVAIRLDAWALTHVADDAAHGIVGDVLHRLLAPR